MVSWQGLGRWCRRNPVLAGVGGVALAALAATVAVSISFGVFQYRAAGDLRNALTDTETQRRAADRLAARLALDRAQTLGEAHEAGQALLWLTVGLESATKAEDDGLQRTIRRNLAAWHNPVRALKAILSLPAPVLAVAYSPDGKALLTGSWDGTARLWDTATGQPLGPILEHPGRVVAVAFSPDGSTILTGSDDGTIRPWEAATGRPLKPSEGDCEPLRVPLPSGQEIQPFETAVAFNADGKAVLTATGAIAVLWETATGKSIGTPLEHRGVMAVAFSPDGRRFATGGKDRTARLWETATGKPIGKAIQHQNTVQALAFTPDGQALLTGSADRTARLWDAATGEPRGPPLEHPQTVGAAVFGNDGRTVLTTSADGIAWLWDAAAGRLLGPPLRHQNTIFAMAFSPDGGRIVTAGSDGTVRVWEAAGSRPAGPVFRPPEKGVRGVDISPDGRTVLTMSTQVVRVWDAATAEPRGQPLRHAESRGPELLRSGGFQHRREDCADADHDACPPLGRGDGNTARRRLPGPGRWRGPGHSSRRPHGPGAEPGRFGPGLGSDHGSALGPPLPHTQPISYVALDDSGQTLLTLTADGTVRLWEVATGNPAGPPWRHQGTIITAVALSPDGRTVLTGDANGITRTEGGGHGPGHRCPPSASRRGGSGTLQLGRPDRSDRKFGRHRPTAGGRHGAGPGFASPPQGAGLGGTAFSPDGTTVLTGSEDGTARLWDASTGQPIGPPFRHGGPLRLGSVAFSPDGRTALTGSLDQTARFWPLPEPIPGDVGRVRLWASVLTGLELDDDQVVRVLDARAWQERRQRLEERGGSPLP